MSDRQQGEKTHSPFSHRKEVMILVITLVAAGVLSIGLYRFWAWERLHPSTDDAYLQANYVWVSSQLDGRVSKLDAEPNQFVKAGEPLFEIDRRPFEAALKKARSQLLLVQQDVKADTARVESARARLAREQASLTEAEQYAKRYQEMVKSGAAAELDAIHYVKTVMEAKSRVAEAQADLDEALLDEGDEQARQARIAAAEADVAIAELDLEWTRVVAPADGYVTQMNLRVGDVVKTQEQLFPFIESERWWVEANFKETDVALIEPGMRAVVTVDSYEDRKFEGRVESVSRGAAASFSLLPPQNTTGNWVKVTQRIPVRIRLLDQDPKHPFRLGASATATVDVDSAPKSP